MSRILSRPFPVLVLAGLSLLAFFGTTPVHAEEKSPLRWEKKILAFEASDMQSPPAKGGVLFLGSSSIRGWDLEKYFPKHQDLLNRGFGGSQISDSIHYVARVVFPYRPRTIVFYAEDNDIAAGESAESVLADYRKFAGLVHAKLPKTRIAFVAIKPSLKRWNLVGEMRKANTAIRKWSARDPRLSFIDIDAPMIGENGRPRPALFAKDGLHLNHQGYVLWSKLVRPHLRTENQLLLASCQFPVSADVGKNAAWIKKQLEESARRGADLVHFSEAALSGYPGADYDPAKSPPRDWKAHDGALKGILDHTRKLGLWVVLGADHRLSKGNKPHNSLYVINPEGKIVDRYDKRFCTGGDLRHYSPGDHFTTFNVKGVKCGLLICYDVRFPELYRTYHLEDVRLMLHSFHNARMREGAVHFIIMPATLQTRAATNNMFVSATNSCARRSWPGLLVTPDGRIASRLPQDEPGILMSLIDADRGYYDASAPYRRRAIEGKLHSGESVDDERSRKRSGH